jgi:hypothetical protein
LAYAKTLAGYVALFALRHAVLEVRFYIRVIDHRRRITARLHRWEQQAALHLLTIDEYSQD